jgi:NADH-quinone oxidoreductase subunit C
MSDYYQQLADRVQQRFRTQITATHVEFSELTVELPREHLLSVCTALRDEDGFHFEQMIDLCGVDYLEYGNGRWQGPRFAVVYHLLSLKHNHRLRLRTFADNAMPVVDSVITVWNSADWYEREAFDLYGIVFDGHPDLRRILTDYGFIGHPFRKDFPLSGNVEMIYDEEQKRVVYQPVSIEPRTLVPRVIRDDHRYQSVSTEGGE